MSRLMSLVMRKRSRVVVALMLVTALGLLASPALAQQTCAQAGGTCRAVDPNAFNTCLVWEMEQSGASCAQTGGQTSVCCAPQACENRSDNAVCYPGVQACPAGTTSLGDGGCANGPCCTQVTTGPTCGERLGRTDGACVQAPESCPANYSYVGPTRDCESCCAPPGAPTPTPTPTPPPTGTGGGGTYRVEYLHTDALGSVRMVTDESGGVVSRHDYYPFGGEIGAGVNGRSGVPGYAPAESGDPRTRERFTGKERDGESGLDYYGARYYSAAQGRFTTPDAPFADQHATAPQSWNLYSYTRNNPLKYIDPDGRGVETAWDVLNVGLGLKSLRDNVKAGNYGSAALDALGVGVDALASAAPFIPGGAGALLKVIRGGDRVDDAADVARSGDVADSSSEILYHYTTAEGAAGIQQSGRILPSAPETYLSVSKQGHLDAGLADRSTTPNVFLTDVPPSQIHGSTGILPAGNTGSHVVTVPRSGVAKQGLPLFQNPKNPRIFNVPCENGVCVPAGSVSQVR